MIPQRYEYLLSILIVQALLWCAHDVQMIVARAACATNPFGELMYSTFTTLAPGRTRKLARARRLSLERALDAFFGCAEWRFGDIEPLLDTRDTSELEQDPIVKNLRVMLEAEAEKSGRDLEAGSDWTLATMRKIAALLRENEAYALHLTASAPLTRDPLNFAQIWFTDMPPVTAASVAILRYIQAEQQIRGLIEDIIPIKGVVPLPRDGTALPAFLMRGAADGDRRPLMRGSMLRARRLLDSYRASILQDRDWNSKDAMSENAGEPSIKKAVRLLEQFSDRRVDDHHGDCEAKRRSYYLLDVLPEHRMSL